MFFTQEDYRKIEQWLKRNSVKDTDFQEALPLKGAETITLVQDGQNKKVLIKDLVDQIFKLGVSDFLNVTDKYKASYITLEEAIRLIPSRARKVGQVITFLNTEGNWQIYQFKGVLNQWNQLDLWKDLYDFSEYVIDSILPDEEDITKVPIDDKGNYVTKFKDKEYDPENFSGRATKILRKHIIEVDDPEFGKIKKNILYLDDFDLENCIYKIRYDFTLAGDVTIPANCILEFDGGSINNGKISLSNNCVVLGNKTILNSVLLNGDGISNIAIKDLKMSYKGNIKPQGCIRFTHCNDVNISGLVIIDYYLEWGNDYTAGLFSNFPGTLTKDSDITGYMIHPCIFFYDCENVTFDDTNITTIVGDPISVYYCRNIVISNNYISDEDNYCEECTIKRDQIWTPINIFYCDGIYLQNCINKKGIYDGNKNISGSSFNLCAKNATIEKCRFIGGQAIDLSNEEFDSTFIPKNVVFRDCVFEDVRFGVQFMPAPQTNHNFIFENCIISPYMRKVAGNSFWQPDAFKISNIDGLTIKDCTIHTFNILNFVSEDTLMLSEAKNICVLNCKVDDNVKCAKDSIAYIPSKVDMGGFAAKTPNYWNCRNITFNSVEIKASKKIIYLFGSIGIQTIHIEIVNCLLEGKKITIPYAEGDVDYSRFVNLLLTNNTFNWVGDGYAAIDTYLNGYIIISGNVFNDCFFYIKQNNNNGFRVIENNIVNHDNGIIFNGNVHNMRFISNNVKSINIGSFTLSNCYFAANTIDINYNGTFKFSNSKPSWGDGTRFIEADGAVSGVRRNGTFGQKPAATDIYVGFKYFCTDKQTVEGATNGIEIIHKGNNVWVDALGRIIS